MCKISGLLGVTVRGPNQREAGRADAPPRALSLAHSCGGEGRGREGGEVPGAGSDVSSQLGACPDS